MMQNTMEIEGEKAAVTFDPDICLFRGAFLGPNGGADFYAASVDGLQMEGAISLRVFRQMCAEQGIEPFRKYAGKFDVRLESGLHEAAVLAARAANKSLNEWVVEAIDRAAKAS